MRLSRKLALGLIGGGVPPPWAVVFNGLSTLINGGTEATIDNLHDNAFTVEMWVKFDSGATGRNYLITKSTGGNNSFFMACRFDTNLFYGTVFCATTAAAATSAFTLDALWHHFAMTWDDAGDRKVRLWRDGALVGTSGAGVGAVVDDAANNLLIGEIGNTFWLKGAIGWVHISNVVRYSATFTPTLRSTPPTVDANTVRLYKLNEGAGTNIADSSANAQAATLTNGTWSKNP